MKFTIFTFLEINIFYLHLLPQAPLIVNDKKSIYKWPTSSCCLDTSSRMRYHIQRSRLYTYLQPLT